MPIKNGKSFHILTVREEMVIQGFTALSEELPKGVGTPTPQSVTTTLDILQRDIEMVILRVLNRRCTIKFLMESLTKFKHIKLPTIMIEHMHKVMTAKDDKHGLAYGFLLNRVFTYFDVECVTRKDRSIKKMFTLSILEENKYIPQRSKVKSNSLVEDIIEVQPRLTGELEEMIAHLEQKDVEIATLKAAYLKA